VLEEESEFPGLHEPHQPNATTEAVPDVTSAPYSQQPSHESFNLDQDFTNNLDLDSIAFPPLSPFQMTSSNDSSMLGNGFQGDVNQAPLNPSHTLQFSPSSMCEQQTNSESQSAGPISFVTCQQVSSSFRPDAQSSNTYFPQVQSQMRIALPSHMSHFSTATGQQEGQDVQQEEQNVQQNQIWYNAINQS
jgi:hypothetical protein